MMKLTKTQKQVIIDALRYMRVGYKDLENREKVIIDSLIAKIDNEICI